MSIQQNYEQQFFVACEMENRKKVEQQHKQKNQQNFFSNLK